MNQSSSLSDQPPPSKPVPKWQSPFFMVLGLVSTGTGIVGVFVPGLPTTVFLIIALWAFSKSSQRLQMWLWTHPKFGPGLRAWYNHRVIPLKAKISAVVVMSLSLAILAATATNWHLPVIVGAIMLPIAVWICTRRGSAPAEA